MSTKNNSNPPTRGRRRPNPSPHNPPSNQSICPYFARTGTCSFGERCRFSHNLPNANTSQTTSSTPDTTVKPQASQRVSICPHFARTGTCSFGERCRFSHNLPNANTSQTTSSTPGTTVKPPASQHVSMCHHFVKTGTCSFGERCRFSHNLPNANTSQTNSSTPGTTVQPQASQRVSMCHHFVKTGTCSFGERCRFSHNLPNANNSQTTSSTPGTTVKPQASQHGSMCHHFVKTGTCSFGERCRFSHNLPNANTSQTTSSTPGTTVQPQASQHVVEFITNLSRDIRQPKFTLRLEDPETKDMWLKSWAAVAVGATINSAEALLRAYMRLPASTAVAPHPHHVLHTLSSVVNHTVANGKRSKGPLLHVLQLVADIIEHRLLPNQTPIPDYLRDDCVTAIHHLRTTTPTALISVITDPHLAERASRLLSRFLALLQSYSRHFETSSTSTVEQQPSSDHPAWAGWRNATVDWLQRGSWLDVPQLQAQYDGVESYTKTLRELVTMLTFYWGAGAVFPKCRHRGHDDRPCGEPLCAVFTGHRRRPCGRRFSSGNVCSAPAKWSCYRKGHDVACDRCLRQMQAAVAGKPGPRASTDIYDAVVGRETVRRGGLVYVLSQLTSRKPPKIAPNWKTTYRLKCSALVGVVRLGASCEPLAPHQRLELAEIVPVHPMAGNTTDFEERQRGRLALRLLTRGDLSSLSPGGEALEHGARVAIIDMQVFVPEVLSVLSTVSDVEFPQHLEAIPFSSGLIGSTPAQYHPTEEDDTAMVISNALVNTEIDLIRRLPRLALKALCVDLVQMVQRIGLDGTQLRAFAAALNKTLHCTQGPPGTGKSYLGVALILALDLIRTYVLKAGIPVGPIVVLSYKNHALDEILMDFLKSDRRLNWHARALIRCGKPEDERLNPFRERNWPEETAARDVLSSRVACMRWVNRTLRDWRSLRAAFLASAEDENGTRRLQEWAPSRCGKDTDGTEHIQKWMLQAVRAHTLVEEMANENNCESAYHVIETLSLVWDKVEETIPHTGPSPYRGLEAKMEHWTHNGPSRKAFLLGKWIFGAKPPPRCVAYEEEGGCLMASSAPGSYCREFHACLYNIKCDKRREGGAQLCGIHRCSYGHQQGRQCRRARLSNNDVCVLHGCPLCIVTKVPRIQPKEFGAGACPHHMCKTPTCDDVQYSEHFPYCAQHGCHLCRLRLAESRHSEIRSIARFEGSRFCKEHKCEVHGCLRKRLFDNESDQNFCAIHACTTCKGKRNQVSDTCPNSRLCDLHRCSQTDERKKPCPERREQNSVFCESHTCRICHEKGLPLDRNVIDSPPRNVCLLHPLCAFVFPNGTHCNRPTGGKGEQYCEQHFIRDLRTKPAVREDRVEEMRCHGVTTRGRPCKAVRKVPVGSKYYFCAPHIGQMPDSSSSESDEDSEGDESVSSNEKDQSEEEFFDTTSAPFFDANPLVPYQTVEPQSLPPRQEYIKQNDGNLDNAGEFQDVNDSDAANAKNESDVESSERHANEESTTSPSATPLAVFAKDNSQTEFEGYQSNNSEKPESAEFHTTFAPVDGQEDQMVDSASDGTSSTTDADNTNERVLFGTNPDECDISEGELSDDDVPDHLQHLHDIIDNESISGSESDEEQVVNAVEDGDEDGGQNMLSHDPSEWNWSQTSAERCRLAAELLRYVCSTWTRLASIADAHVERARRERAEAAGFVFKNARLIGATVVGATRRLQAIRASEPFAMIVEEACEVLEPTLVAVLAVRSLQKLELIGDHRQLPAFVQPCWFSIQMTHPSIKVSLFERLVNKFSLKDGSEGGSASSVLDIQRRMRPEICALTRCEYDDLIRILDDPCTIARRIGDGNSTEILNMERDLWSSRGRNVPGIQSQVFFWNLKTQEGRAAVGLSRCNYGEAEACANLVGWFLQCGIPAASISVITPYKGQKLTVLKMLRKVRGAVPQKGRGFTRSDEKGVIVSTVDKYQGDENDIVILSLVCTRPGNRFIALRNRFIVASSRARLGFIIVGCTDALTRSAHGGDGPSHWRRLLKDLAQNENVDHTADQDSDVGLSRVPRICDKLSIRCPRHPETMLEISESSEFPHLSEGKLAEFCSKICPYLLPWCGHGCKVPCHKPTVVPHTSKCNENVQRPCVVHENVVLQCHAVKDAKGASTGSLNDALKVYDCEIMTEWRRPDCSHAVEVRCHVQKELAEGTHELSVCTERVSDYVNPLCGHITHAPKCHIRRKWEGDPPKCQKIVTYERPCGCRARMACYQRVHETCLDIPPLCKEAVSRSRPRCSHSLSSRCHEATALQELWLEEHGEVITSNPPLVIHGIEYGPSETRIGLEYPDRFIRDVPQCHILTQYQSSCGHIITVPCSEAFELAAGRRKENLCMDEKVFRSPLCGHHIKGPCYISSIESQPHAALASELDTDTVSKSVQSILHESVLKTAPSLDPRLKKITKLCTSNINAVRLCGHITEKIPCSRLFSIFKSKKLPPCAAHVSLKRSCGHEFETLCHRREDEHPICTEAVDEEFSYPCGRAGHTIQPGTCSELTSLRGLVNPKCPIEVQCIRARCKHLVSVPCHLEESVTAILPGTCLGKYSECAVVRAGVTYCESEAHVAGCTEPVMYQRECGHAEVGVQCKIAFDWTSMDEEAPLCCHQVEVTSPLCGHLLKVPCHQESSFHIDLWKGVTVERLTMRFDEYSVTSPIVEENQSVPLHPPASIAPFLKCGLTTRFVRSCGHEEDIPCESIFESIQSKCHVVESQRCADCGFLVDVPCSKRSETATPSFCKNIVEKTCSLCSANSVRVECYKQTARCQSEVNFSLPCGHVATWICGQDDPISASDAEKCLRCMKDQWNMAMSEAREAMGDENGIAKEGPSNVGHPKAKPYNVRFASLLQRIQDRAFQSFSSSCIQSHAMLTVFDVKHLWTAYLDILSSNIDSLSSAMEDGNDADFEVSPPPDIFDVSQSYDLVYRVLSAQANPEESFKHTDTVYGFGAEAKVLSMEALGLDCHECGRNGSLSICVGGALKYRTLTGTDPFRTRTTKKKRKSKKNRKDESKASRLMQDYRRAGFDSVAHSDEKRGYERVYWIPGAVIPLMKLELQLLRTCGICRDDMLPSKGWACPETHFVCHSCFIMFIEQATQPDCGTRIVDGCGNLLCPYEGCGVTYDELSLLRQPHDGSDNEIHILFEGLRKLKMTAHAKQEVNAALDVQKRQLQAEFQRVMQIKDQDERRAETLRLEIVDQILTLRCPVERCRKAFFDFEGCFDLTCSACRVHFCAWCIRHCSASDVHSHVLGCRERSSDGLYHRLEVFHEHHRRRRKRLVIQRLGRENADVRKRALTSLDRDLRDLDIEI